MPGLFVALLVFGFKYAFGSGLESGFLSGTNVLYWWYLLWSVPIGLLALVIVLVFTVLGGFGGSTLGKWGAVLGMGAAGTASVGLALLMLVRRGLFIIGAYVLHTSVTLGAGGYVWDRQRVIVGAVMVGLPIILGMLTRGSSTATTQRAQQLLEHKS